MRHADAEKRLAIRNERPAVDVVYIFVHQKRRSPFGAFVTRVPCIGEHLSQGGLTYRVVRVQHQGLSFDGVVGTGWHAHIDVEETVDD